MLQKELLAPAGDINAGYAALYYGADAVYLGLQQFSARATATNFSPENLDEFTAFAHSLQRKVYVTINTLVQEAELPDLMKTLDVCSRCRVDAIILQDLGVAKIIKDVYPELELHASTQMAVHNKEGALALQKAGFSRVVLARELSLPEIEEIAALPGLETEAFIHGALCYSYSGLCLFSSLETGKSANRGKCLYPCRSLFDGEDGEKHYFSMKDMALQRDILKMPVTSLKIEGRKKTDLYVAAVTDYYRHILDGKGADAFREENIKQIFSRPWCHFHFNGKDKNVIDRDFVGHRGLLIGKAKESSNQVLKFVTNHLLERHDGIQIDVEGQEKPFGFALLKLKVKGKEVFEAKPGENVEIKMPPHAPKIKVGADIYLASASAVKAYYKYEKPKPAEYKNRQQIDVKVSVWADKLMAAACGVCFEVDGNFAKAQNPVKTTEAAQKAFAKTGDTVFELGKLNLENEQGLFVPASVFNELRRGLYAQIKLDHKQGILPQVPERKLPQQALWAIKTDCFETLQKIDLNKVAEIIFLLGKDTKVTDLSHLPKEKVRLALPCVCRKTSVFEKKIADFVQAGYQKWEIANYWGLEALRPYCVDIRFDSPIYVMNSQATVMAKDLGATSVTLSLEDTMDNLKLVAKKSCLPVVFPVYTDVSLFTSAACIRSNPCSVCRAEEKWMTLEKNGKKYQVLSRDCQTMLFFEAPLCHTREAKEITVDVYRVDFAYKKYSAEAAAALWKKCRNFDDIDGAESGNINRRKAMF